jgi:type II secretory pathway pseudopilin PulG
MSGRRGEQGYNLVLLIVAITVLSIALAAALPAWSTAAQREREEELIFRGLQYAEAIRLFQQRFGRLPVRLEELMEVEPRCIRQLWTDPMTGERDWRLIRGETPMVPGAPVPGGEVAPPSGLGDEEDDGRSPDDTGLPESEGAEDLPDGGAAAGPIRGVRSRSRDEALKTFFDKERYDQWLFTVDMLAAGGGGPRLPGVGIPGAAQASPAMLRTRWLGRPFRQGVQAGGANDSGLPTSDLGLGDPPPPDAPEDPAPLPDKN